MAKLPPAERETIITFSDETETANIYTYDKRLKRKLDTLCAKCEGFYEVSSSEDGAKDYVIPKRFVTIREPMSAERKEKLRKQALEHGFFSPKQE